MGIGPLRGHRAEPDIARARVTIPGGAVGARAWLYCSSVDLVTIDTKREKAVDKYYRSYWQGC